MVSTGRKGAKRNALDLGSIPSCSTRTQQMGWMRTPNGPRIMGGRCVETIVATKEL